MDRICTLKFNVSFILPLTHSCYDISHSHFILWYIYDKYCIVAIVNSTKLIFSENLSVFLKFRIQENFLNVGKVGVVYFPNCFFFVFPLFWHLQYLEMPLEFEFSLIFRHFLTYCTMFQHWEFGEILGSWLILTILLQIPDIFLTIFTNNWAWSNKISRCRTVWVNVTWRHI